MVQPMHPRGIPEDAAFLIADEGVFRETVPKPGHHIMEFTRTRIAFGMVHMFRHAEIARRIGVGGGDNIPPCPPGADMIQGGKAPRDMIGRIIGSGGRGDQPDPFRYHRKGR